MSNAPKIRGLVPTREEEPEVEVPTREEEPEVEATQVPKRAPKPATTEISNVSWARPKHDKMNFYPTQSVKEQFIEAVDALVRDAGRVEGTKLKDGLVHDVTLRFALTHWDKIRAMFIPTPGTQPIPMPGDE